MKNLNKVLAMLVVFMMMLSTVAFASSFSDVADGSSYSTAIEVGVDLDLFKGYTDGTFGPEGEITRAEVAAIIVRLLGQEAQAEGAKAATMFIDVPADHWAAGYINIAVQAGVINGYGNGYFGPEDLVEYQDAIAMIVRALGYEPAIGSAGYPTGYLTKAGELGLTSNVSGTNGVAINRAAVAQIAFNSLDVPIMTQSGYGTFTQYVINDGYSSTMGTTNVKKTLLSENHSTVKLQGTVTKSSDSMSTSTTAAPYVNVTVTDGLRNKFGIGITSSGEATNEKMFVGESDAMDYVGKKVVLFVEYDEFEDEMTIKALYEVKTDVLTIDLADVVEFTKDGDIEYYVNDSKKTTATLSESTKVFYNGVEVDTLPVTAEELLQMSGTIELSLLSNDTTDADYDTMYITAYDVFVVDEVVPTSKRVTSKIDAISFNGRISFDEEDGDVKATLVDANGDAMEWTDLVEYDVLSVKYVNTGVKDIYEAKVINNTVTGTVTGLTGIAGEDNREVEIDGVAYDVLTVAEYEKEMKLGDEGTYYLDDNDNVIYHSATITRNNNYAYLIKIKPADEMDNAQVKLLTKENGIVTIDVATKITVAYKGEKATNLSTKNILTELPAEGDVFADFEDMGYEDLEGMIITYKVNASGQLTTVEIPAWDTDEDWLSISGSNEDMVDYDADASSFKVDGKKHYITENTVIFYVPAGEGFDEDDYEVVALANLSDDQDLTGADIYDVDEDRNIGAIALTAENQINPSANNATFVVKVSETTDEDGYDVIRVSGYKGLEEVSYICDDVDASEIIGKLVTPVYKANGDVNYFNVIGDKFDDVSEDDEIEAAYGKLAVYNDGDEYVSPVDSRRKLIVINGGTDTAEEYKIDSSANIYVYDNDATTRNKHKVGEALAYVEFDVTDKDKGTYTMFVDGEESEATVTAYMYIYDGDVVDVLYFID